MTENNVNGISSALPLGHPSVRLLAAAAATGLLLSSAGAFDTESAAFAPRLAYWLAMAMLSLTALEGLHRLLVQRLGDVHALILRLVGWAVLALPLNMVAVLSCKLLFGGSPSLGGFLLLLPGMSAILAALQFLLVSLQPGRIAPAAEPAPPPCAEGLAGTLPLPLRSAAILALEAQDHYVRVHSSQGQVLIRMRLADAISLMSEEGVRPHRSWWVARSAIASLQRHEGRPLLILEGGQRVPVSRSARRLLGPWFMADG